MSKDEEAKQEGLIEEALDSIGWTAFLDWFLPSLITALIVSLAALSLLYLIKF